MFAAPPDIETRVFARLPDQFRRPNTRSHWADLQMRGDRLFVEGVCLARQLDFAVERLVRYA